MNGGNPPPKIVSHLPPQDSKIAKVVSLKKPHLNIVKTATMTDFETRPCFASSWVQEIGSVETDCISNYSIAGVQVRILSPKNSSCGTYAVWPPEYDLNPIHLRTLAEALEDVMKKMPNDFDLRSISVLRSYIKTKAKDYTYARLANASGRKADARSLDREADRLAELLSKYTAGYGILETLLDDMLVQDIYIDAPSSETPVHVVLRSDTGSAVRQKCQTNIYVGKRDLQGLVSRIKLETGLPFSEAHPVLEAEMKRLGARVTIVGPPLSERGVSVAIRKHSEGIWTMPTLIANGSVSPLLASFLWACVIGRRTALIAGSRGAGKTTLLGAMLLEFPLSQRIVLIEDTPEICVSRLQELGYDIQALRFSGSWEKNLISAQEALRVSLRLGESAIVIGEVRGLEAKVLYESMRAGSAGSSVLGTIHGNSAEGVLDRAVEDLGISERAFSSTDIVVVTGLIRSPDGTRFTRRVTEVAEVRDSGASIELVDLFATERGCNCAKPTNDYTSDCRTIRGVAAALGLSPETMMEIIKTRAHADQLFSEEITGGDNRHMELLRVKSNEVLTRCILTATTPETGLHEWRSWFDARTRGED